MTNRSFFVEPDGVFAALSVDQDLPVVECPNRDRGFRGAAESLRRPDHARVTAVGSVQQAEGLPGGGDVPEVGDLERGGKREPGSRACRGSIVVAGGVSRRPSAREMRCRRIHPPLLGFPSHRTSDLDQGSALGLGRPDQERGCNDGDSQEKRDGGEAAPSSAPMVTVDFRTAVA